MNTNRQNHIVLESVKEEVNNNNNNNNKRPQKVAFGKRLGAKHSYFLVHKGLVSHIFTLSCINYTNW
jgi:hypothetical protein